MTLEYSKLSLLELERDFGDLVSAKKTTGLKGSPDSLILSVIFSEITLWTSPGDLETEEALPTPFKTTIG